MEIVVWYNASCQQLSCLKMRPIWSNTVYSSKTGWDYNYFLIEHVFHLAILKSKDRLL